MSALVEHDAIAANHPRFVTPLGDRRERKVPCRQCGHHTSALAPTVCVQCDPISEDSASVCAPSDAGDVSDSIDPERDVAGMPAEDRVVDLMAALEESVAAAKAEREARTNRNAPVAADTAPGQ